MTPAERPDAGEGLVGALFDVLFAHQSIPRYDGSLGNYRCAGAKCADVKVAGPNSPTHAHHVATMLAAAVERLLAARETAAAEAVVGRVEAVALRIENSDDPNGPAIARELRAALRAGEAGDE